MAEIKPQRGLTPRAFLVGFVLVLVWLLYDCTLGNDPMLGSIDLLYQIGFGALFTLFAVTCFNNRLDASRRLTPQELTVIYAMLAVAIPWGFLLRSALETPVKMIVLYHGKHEEWLAWMKSPYVIESEDAIEAFRRGGVSFSQIAWRAWRAPMLYWGAILVAFQTFAICLVLFFRRLFVEEEKLPFPMATAGLTLVEHRPTPSNDVTSRRFLLCIRAAFIAGLLMTLPGVLSVSGEGARSIPMNVYHYSTLISLVPGRAVRIAWDPFVLCFLMFFPVDVLFTVVVLHVTMRLAMPMTLRWLGMATTGGIGDFFSEGWILHVFGIGGLAGLVFWTLFFNRRRIRDWLLDAVTARRKPRGSNPVGLRVIVVMLVLSAIAFVLLFLYGLGDISDAPVRHLVSSVLVLAVIFGMLFAIMRQSAEAGWQYHSPWTLGKVIGYPHKYYMIHPTPLWHTRGSFFAIGHVLFFGAYHNTFAPHIGLFGALKMAYVNGTKTRDVLKAVVVTLVVTIPLVFVGYLTLIHHFGFEHGYTSAAYANYTFSQPMLRMAYEATPTLFSAIPPWFGLVVGAVIIGAVMYMKREYVRFPFSPVGVVITAAFSQRGYGTRDIWFLIVVAFLMKRAIYKWFGVKFFRTRALPVVIYVMMGLMTGMLIYRMLFAAVGRGLIQGM